MIDLSQQIAKIKDRVGGSMTPAGHLVAFLLPRGHFLTTKDGLTILSTLKFKDPVEQLVLHLITNGSEATVSGPGDGTSSTVVMIDKMYRQLKPRVTDPQFYKGFMDCIHETTTSLPTSKYLLECTEERLKDLAMSCSNQDEDIATLVQEAYRHTTGEVLPTVVVEREPGLVVENGMTIPAGYFATNFVTDQLTRRSDLENPLVLVCDKVNHGDMFNLQNCLDRAYREGRPLVVVAKEVCDQAIVFLAKNHQLRMSGQVKEVVQEDGTKAMLPLGCLSCIVELQHGGSRLIELVQDLRHKTGAGDPLDHTFPEDPSKLGTADRILTSKEECSIITDQDVREYVEGLQRETPPDSDKNWHKTRVDRLSSVLVKIGIGGDTMLEREERRHRLEDTVLSYGSALREGILPGFGMGYLLVRPAPMTGQSNCSKPYMEGWNAALESMSAVTEQCCLNCGIRQDTNWEKLLLSKSVYNAVTDQTERWDKTSVVDSAAVVRQVLSSAASIAGQLAKTQFAEFPPED